MKKLILIGIIMFICCSVFLIIRQNSSRADITMDLCAKTYPVPFGEWVLVYLSAKFRESTPYYFVDVACILIEGKNRYHVTVIYKDDELGREWYQMRLPHIKEVIRIQCKIWTLKGYPISLNDFEFDITNF